MISFFRPILAALVIIGLIFPLACDAQAVFVHPFTVTYDYDAFGILLHSTGTTPNNYLYSGEQFDPDLGLYYNRARYLNISTGRFWNMDAFEGDSGSPESLHKYLYAAADPINSQDPTGNDGELVSALGAAAISGFLSATALSLYQGKGVLTSIGYGLAGAAVALTLTANIITGGTLLAAVAGVSTATGIVAYGGVISGVLAINSLTRFLAASGGPEKNAAATGLVVALAGFFIPLSAGTPNVATESELIDAIAARGQAGSGRAVGYSIFEADGQTGFATAISGKSTARPGGLVGNPTAPKFSPVPGYEYDVEYKLLENAASQLSPTSSGRMVIVINKDYVCMSCVSAVRQFKQAYPGVQIEVRTAGGRLAANPFD